jgi:hypothetical protein
MSTLPLRDGNIKKRIPALDPMQVPLCYGQSLMRTTRREALVLCATPLFAQTRPRNHTYSHQPLFRKITAAEFEADILQNDGVLRSYSGFRKWFRFPALNEGQTRELRDRFRSFLAKHGYRNGAVTIDASDWYYNQRLLARLKQERGFDVTLYRQPYLDHIWDRAQFYDQLSRDVLGRGVPHTLLIHYNMLNALFLGDLLTMFRSKGWGVIDAEEAFSDEVFTRQPDTVPAGQSLIWALAKETGKFEVRLRYPGEDDVYEKPALDRLGL